MKTRIIALVHKHPLATLIGAVLLGVLLLYLATGAFDSFRHWREDKAVTGLENKAAQSEQQAAKEDVNRQAEDLNRERTIQPELERTRRELAAARERTRKAEIDYENARKNIPDNGGTDTRALHDRNCADLRELYPGESIPFCQN
jgi:hypothetical protein